MKSLTVLLPAAGDRWGDPAVASFVGQRFYADIGRYSFVGKVTFARAVGDRDDDTITGSHVELRIDDPMWAVG